jgi:hypothetical protein
MNRRSLFVSPALRNKTMNADVYALRREVIALVYQAKALLPAGWLPRITVRITDDHDRLLGCAEVGKCVIWITESYVASRHVVFHEILHAAFGQQHVAGCPLMGPTKKTTPDDATLDSLFIGYATAIR